MIGKKHDSYINDLLNQKTSDTALLGSEAVEYLSLYNAEVNVPEAFCITSITFDDFLTATNSVEQIMEALSAVHPFIRQSAEKASEKVCNIIMNSEMPSAIEEKLARAFGKITYGKSNIPVEIQISNVIEHKFIPENLVNFKYSNIFTFDDFITKIKLSWATLFSVESIELRTNSYYRGPITTAVFVRQMKKFEQSGMTYSTPRVTKEAGVVEVSAIHGVRDNRIALDMVEDSYKINLDSMKIIERHVLPQQRMVVRKGIKDNDDNYTIMVDISPEWQRRQKLTDEMILKLVELTLMLEKSFGPIAMEWGVEAGDITVTNIQPIEKEEKISGDYISEVDDDEEGITERRDREKLQKNIVRLGKKVNK